MMVEGFGIDMIEVKRIGCAIERWGRRFLERVYTEREIAYCEGKGVPEQHLAARFAAKEAVYKAFGGERGLSILWTDVEILNEEDGRPKVILKGNARRLRERRGILKAMVSLSHTRDYAIGSCILLK